MPYQTVSPDEVARRQERAGPGAVNAVMLRKRRIRTGIPARIFAAEVGLTAKHYRNIETAQKQPSPEALARIANRIGCEPDELLVRQVAA